jgi:lipopolysaccharide export system protein LptA
MRQKRPTIFIIYILLILMQTQFLPTANTYGRANELKLIYVGQDLHLAGREVIGYKLGTEKGSKHILVFPKGFSFVFGDNRFFSDSAVIWLASMTTKPSNRDSVGYEVQMYLQGNTLTEDTKNDKAVVIKRVPIEQGSAMIISFGFTGEVFVTAEQKETADPRGMELYIKAFAAVGPTEPQFKPILEQLAEVLELEEPAVMPEEKGPRFMYLSPAGEVTPQIEWDTRAKIVTVIGRSYVWQKQDESDLLLELQADNAVIFLAEQTDRSGSIESFDPAQERHILAAEKVQAIYLSGDVIMTEGQRTIRADEIYYDFRQKQALAINAVVRTFDVSRGIPIYVRAAKLKQLAENTFAAEDITLTTSEFYLPQLSINASQVNITDTTPVDERSGKLSDGSYDAEMRDVRFKLYDKTFFFWPHVRSNLQRPDVPLKSVRIGNDRTWGTSIETQWYLARLLGLHESKGTDSTVSLDYYSKRGLGSGAEINYTREDYFGRMFGYIINDSGKDRLGRTSSRRDIEPPRDLRGRFRWQHRHFLPYNWQLTAEASYISDENFIEQYNRREFYTDKEQETVLHLKRIENNWGLAVLGKARLNDFQNVIEEQPSAEFHWTGQSFHNDKLTFYSDTQISQFRQRLASSSTSTAAKDFYTFTSTRNELDLPMIFGRSKAVPFIAGTFGYDDGSGFRTSIDGSTEPAEKTVWLGEAGMRASTNPFWKIYPNVKSRLWDLRGLRHIISPQLTAVAYAQDDSVIEQRDTLSVGLSQRLQTKRGIGNKERTVDWMRLDTDVTWVNDSGDASAGPDRFIWNKPFIPLANSYSRRFGQAVIPPQDRRSSDIFGPRRNYFSADYIWNLTDTTALLSDMNFDMQSGVVQQYNIGVSALRWPNISYYIGSRYLRRVQNGLGEKGSNAFTFAATYVLDPRYTAVFSQQYDFDYGVNVRSEITLIRRYHRINFALTYSVDESMDQHSAVFSIWPEGLIELALGTRRHMDIGRSTNY